MSVIFLLAATVMSSAAVEYDLPTLVHTIPRDAYEDSIEINRVTEMGMVAGNNVETDANGQMFICPFVWKEGKVTWLPLKNFLSGRVFAATDRQVVGTVFDGENYSAIWEPDPIKGWSKPTLKSVGPVDSYAVDAWTDGTVWTHIPRTQEIIRDRQGKLTKYKVGADVAYAAADTRGRLFVNTPNASKGSESRPSEVRMVTDQGSGLFGVTPSRIMDINTLGDLVGWQGDEQVMWPPGETPVGICPKAGFSARMAINSREQVVGTIVIEKPGAKPEPHAYVYQSGEVRDLTREFPFFKLSRGLDINEKGWILASSWTDSNVSFYLIKPKKK